MLTERGRIYYVLKVMGMHDPRQARNTCNISVTGSIPVISTREKAAQPEIPFSKVPKRCPTGEGRAFDPDMEKGVINDHLTTP